MTGLQEERGAWSRSSCEAAGGPSGRTNAVRRPLRRGRRLLDTRGQGMVEYGLILLLVAIAVVIALTAVGGKLATVFNSVKNGLV